MRRRLLIAMFIASFLVPAAEARPFKKATAEVPEVTKGRKTGDRKAKPERAAIGTRQAAQLLLVGRAKPEWQKRAGPRPKTLRNPLIRGTFVRGFAEKGEGGHLALDLGAKVGTRVQAAADGLVIYAGDEIKGYGTVVMILHGGNVFTLYAHLDSHGVRGGQRVRRGQNIGRVGQTGIAKGPHLHFELQIGGQQCDPAPLLRPGLKRRNGKAVPGPKLIWRGPAPPEGVRCVARARHGAGKPASATPPHEPADENIPDLSALPGND